MEKDQQNNKIYHLNQENKRKGVSTYCKQHVEEDEEAFEASVNFSHLQFLVIGSHR